MRKTYDYFKKESRFNFKNNRTGKQVRWESVKAKKSILVILEVFATSLK